VREREAYPPGVPCWVDTAQPDPEAAVEFYGGLFGWEFEDRMPADHPVRYFVARLAGGDVAAVGSPPDGGPPTPVWSTYVAVESADDAAAKVKEAGGTVVTEPFDIPDAGRMAVFSDPEGAVFCVWQARDHKGARLVNEPGAWVFSDLNTRDPEQASAFYRAVFGWELTDFDGFSVFRLPGYGDFLAQGDPEIRRRQSEEGAPAGFEDVVAGVRPMTSDQFPDEVPPHWSVTFSVDDTDAAAERATALGGKVTVPPFDVPPVRVAVLSDPQGAVFSVSKYTPAA
jgi:predicted enzyme related to lactoylglutathione lyase